MAQIFSRRFTLILRIGFVGTAAPLIALTLLYRMTGRRRPENDAIEQPVPFSHQHHVRDDGIDCRYCHTSVETSAFAGIPPLATCMTCHS